MSRVMFIVTYSIDTENLPQYEELIRRLKKITTDREIDYSVYKEKDNHFTEVTVYESQEAFDQADDLMDDEVAGEYINRVNLLARDIHYRTLNEVVDEE